MKEEIGIIPNEVWGCLPDPIISLKLENVFGCVGYIGNYEDLDLQLSKDEVNSFH